MTLYDGKSKRKNVLKVADVPLGRQCPSTIKKPPQLYAQASLPISYKVYS